VAGGTPPAHPPDPSADDWRADLEDVAGLMAEMSATGPSPAGEAASPPAGPPAGAPATRGTAAGPGRGTDGSAAGPGRGTDGSAAGPGRGTDGSAARRRLGVLASLPRIHPRAAAVTLVVALASGTLAAVEMLLPPPVQSLRPGYTTVPPVSPGPAPSGAPTLLATPEVTAPASPAAGAPPAATTAAPAPPPARGAGAATSAVPAPNPVPPAPRPVPVPVPPSVPATPAATAPATAAPTPPAFAVTAASITMGTCYGNARGWACPYRATFTVTPGVAGTISWHLMGRTTTCAGSTSSFDWPQSNVQAPGNGTGTVTQSGWVIVPGPGHPASVASGKGASTVLIHVVGPDEVRSAPQRFYGASCP
jgi:hypothetical protein